MLAWPPCPVKRLYDKKEEDKTYKSLLDEQEHIGFKRKREIELGIANQVLGLASASNQQASK